MSGECAGVSCHHAAAAVYGHQQHGDRGRPPRQPRISFGENDLWRNFLFYMIATLGTALPIITSPVVQVPNIAMNMSVGNVSMSVYVSMSVSPLAYLKTHVYKLYKSPCTWHLWHWFVPFYRASTAVFSAVFRHCRRPSVRRPSSVRRPVFVTEHSSEHRPI